MAKKTPKFGDLPFVQLTTTCTTVNIIESAVEKSLLPLSLLCWAVPVVAHWRCELAKPRVFCCSARCSHQSYSVSISTSSKTGNYFLYRHLALSLPESPRTTPMPPDLHRLDALVAGVSLKKFGPISREVGKTSGTQGGYHQDFSSVLSYHDFRGGFLRATSRIYVAHGRRGQIVATAARTPRSKVCFAVERPLLMYLTKEHHANPSKNLSSRREVVVVIFGSCVCP